MLELRQISKTFHPGTPNEVRSLRGVSLTIDEGSVVVVIGTNGSGKSTLLNAIAGTFHPDSGQILLDGKDITDWPEHRRAKNMGRVFQNPFTGTAPGMTIGENLALAAKRGRHGNLGWAVSSSMRKQFEERVGTLRLGLENRLDNDIGNLSGGQRQALTLLMATWKKPRMLLLDEHTAALDPRSAEQVIRLTDVIFKRDRMATLMVTHSMSQAIHMGDRLIMMHKGEIVMDVSGAEKKRLRVADLLQKFDEIRRTEQLDSSAADLLREVYV